VIREEEAMRRIRQVTSLLVGLVLVGLAAGDQALAQADKKTIKVGMLQMLTGDLARYGIPLRDAGLYAVEELNAAGGINGRKIEVLLEDVGSTPQGSVQAALKLIQRDRVDVLMQGGTSGHTLATIPVADEHKIVMANMSTAENITQQGSKWTFRVARVPNSILDRKFAQYVVKEMKLQQVAALYGNDEMGRDAATIFIKALEVQGVKPVAVEQVQVGDPDVSAQVTRVKAANPQAIFVQGHSNEATKIIRTIRQMIPGNVLILGFDQMTTSKFIEESGGAANLEGMIYRTGTLGEQSADKDLHAFVTKWKARYPNSDTLLPMIQYAGMQVLFEALRQSGNDLSREGIRDAFYKVQNFKTILGPVSVQTDGETMNVVHIMKLVNGKGEIVRENY
jgi:branched-chain amino acid transport system substrate-binding protein